MGRVGAQVGARIGVVYVKLTRNGNTGLAQAIATPGSTITPSFGGQPLTIANSGRLAVRPGDRPEQSHTPSPDEAAY